MVIKYETIVTCFLGTSKIPHVEHETIARNFEVKSKFTEHETEMSAMDGLNKEIVWFLCTGVLKMFKQSVTVMSHIAK